MLIADLARRAGVKVSTVRFYLRTGLLDEPTRTPGGYREFTDAHLRRVRFLHRGRELGFTLTELASLEELSRRARGGDAAELVTHARRKLVDLDARIADLRRTRDALASLVDGPGFDPDADCPVVAALTGRHGDAGGDCTAPEA